MRTLFLLLSIYITFLTVVPCEHNHSSTDSSRIEASHHSPADKQSTNHCSPFCICNCCNTLVVLNYDFFQLKGWSSGSELTILYLAPKPVQVSFSIWEPPKPVYSLA